MHLYSAETGRSAKLTFTSNKTTMPLLTQYVHVIGAFQGLLLASLLIFGGHVSTASRILGGWCLFLALSFLARFITMEPGVNIFSPLIGWSFYLPASYGAFLYLYCRQAITGDRLRWRDLLHFSPLLVCWLLNLDFLTMPAEAKVVYFWGGGHGYTWKEPVSKAVLFLQSYGYLALSAVFIYRSQRRAGRTLANYNPDIFSWLWKVLLLDLIIWILKTVGHVPLHNYTLSTLGDVLIIVLIYSIALSQWRNPKLFRIAQLAAIPAAVDGIGGAGVSGAGKGATTPQNTGALDDDIRSSLLNTVRDHMQQHKTYLDNELTLASLAAAVGVSTHHLSEVLNQKEGKNFYQFVNKYRIEFVCEQMSQDSSVKIIDLAMTAGFSSKSTFNAVFKQFTGQTPSQYRSTLAAG